MISVPEEWLKGLQNYALAAYKEHDDDFIYDSENKNMGFHMKAMSLMGYAKSVENILKYGDRHEET